MWTMMKWTMTGHRWCIVVSRRLVIRYVVDLITIRVKCYFRTGDGIRGWVLCGRLPARFRGSQPPRRSRAHSLPVCLFLLHDRPARVNPSLRRTVKVRANAALWIIHVSWSMSRGALKSKKYCATDKYSDIRVILSRFSRKESAASAVPFIDRAFLDESPRKYSWFSFDDS